MTLFGILNVNKAPGRTSRDVVNEVQKLARPAKVGHAGTLDPLATGVLVICVGGATRLTKYVQRMPKQYQATFLLGRRSETDDVEGEVVDIPGVSAPTRALLEQALPQFVGEIEQRPPAHSAVKIGGRRAYALARKGKAVELSPRPVTIHRLTIASYEYPQLVLEIECGSGTYVRALGRDLASALGTGAVMSALERTAIGRFHIEDALAVGALAAEKLPRQLHPALAAVDDLPRVNVTDEELNEIRNGRPISDHEDKSGSRGIGSQGTINPPAPRELAAVDRDGRLVAILRSKAGEQLWPAMNFL